MGGARGGRSKGTLQRFQPLRKTQHVAPGTWYYEAGKKAQMEGPHLADPWFDRQPSTLQNKCSPLKSNYFFFVLHWVHQLSLRHISPREGTNSKHTKANHHPPRPPLGDFDSFWLSLPEAGLPYSYSIHPRQGTNARQVPQGSSNEHWLNARQRAVEMVHGASPVLCGFFWFASVFL